MNSNIFQKMSSLKIYSLEIQIAVRSIHASSTQKGSTVGTFNKPQLFTVKIFEHRMKVDENPTNITRSCSW